MLLSVTLLQEGVVFALLLLLFDGYWRQRVIKSVLQNILHRFRMIVFHQLFSWL